MTNLSPSDKALVPFVSVDHMMKLIHHIGLRDMLKGIAGYIEDDFKRWESFDKTPRIGSHTDDGVMELMPTSDGQDYGFKYVNCIVLYCIRFDSIGYRAGLLGRWQ